MKLKKLNLKSTMTLNFFTLFFLFSQQAIAHTKLEINGLIEASITKEQDSNSQGAINTLQVGVVGHANSYLYGEIIFLQEDINTEEQSELGVDSAAIYLKSPIGMVSAGKFTMLFSTGETNMIEDASTLVEPNGVGVSLSGQLGWLEYNVYAANPYKDNASEITAKEYFGKDLKFGDLKGVNFNIGFSKQIDINVSYALIAGEYAISAALAGDSGKFGYVLETTEIENEPRNRCHVEGFYDLNSMRFSASLQTDAYAVRYRSLGFLTEVYDNTSLKLQYLQTEDDGDTSQSIAALLAYEF